jgi:hypothetical protein
MGEIGDPSRVPSYTAMVARGRDPAGAGLSLEAADPAPLGPRKIQGQREKIVPKIANLFRPRWRMI